MRGAPWPGLGALRVDQDDGRVDVEADGQRLGATECDVDDLRHDVDTWRARTGVRRRCELDADPSSAGCARASKLLHAGQRGCWHAVRAHEHKARMARSVPTAVAAAPTTSWLMRHGA